MVVWLRVCRQSAEEYWEVLRMLFSTAGRGALNKKHDTVWAGMQFRWAGCEVPPGGVVHPFHSRKFVCSQGVLLFALQFYFNYL